MASEVLVAMPLDTLFTNPNPAVPRSKSLLSRFSNPLANHAGKMFDVSVEPEDQFKVYSPGESVRGHVVLTVSKGFDITHLVVALHGYAKVYKHQIAPGEKVPVQESILNSKGSKGFEYHGNGLASLFQEEQILCGNGFLKKQVYKFAFELQFPARSMPSTIEFERGNVSYMISATVTRPVAINPTHSRYKRIKFQDTVDIQAMDTPKSRVISLEPLNKRGKVKKVRASGSVGTQEASSRSQLTRKNTQSSVATSATIPVGNPPLSPAPSDDTVATTASTVSFQQIEHEPPARKPSPQTSEGRSTTTSSSAHTITATTELPRHGALPGDSIPVRVHVAHTKPYVKGVVIATLYRLGRVDMHPEIPLVNKSKDKDKQPEYEDVYPKSKTGLGGLYFASSSPSSVFRKDLSQSSTMMIVNPTSLSADVSTSVKVPEDAFPTITNVPGGMISFTYHIEVVVDLFGKLGETRYLPRLTSSDPMFTNSENSRNQLTHDWSNNILDTAQLRRTKSVVTFEMSVTVGTRDSGRNKKRNRPEDDRVQQIPQQQTDQQWPESTYYEGWGYEGYDWYYDENGQPQWYDQGYTDWQGYDISQGYEPNDWHLQHQAYGQQPVQSVHLIPPPPPETEEEVDEKTRMRRQEALLLPSQPPQDGESSSSTFALAPSAPTMDHAPTLPESGADGLVRSSPSTPGPPGSVASADTIRPYSTSPPPMLPTSESEATDDKQEMERRRLMEQASAPPADEEEMTASSSRATATAHVPSAPVINDDTHEAHATSADERRGSILPEYRR